MTREVNELLKELRESFPLTNPYHRDRLKNALSYIFEIRKWATKNLGVVELKE